MHLENTFRAFGTLERGPIMTPVKASKKLRQFDTKTFLSTINGGRKIEAFPKRHTIFAQGDSSDSVFYIQKGKVKLTVVSNIGKEATIGILNEGDFFGECLTGQPLRLGSATAMTDCSVMKIGKKSVIEVLHREHAFSDMFVAYLLTRNIRYEEDLVDQLFNSSEKRLARILLLLAHFGKEGKPETLIPKMSQETLAEMVGTTRSRVSFFMNRFRKLGFSITPAVRKAVCRSTARCLVLFCTTSFRVQSHGGWDSTPNLAESLAGCHIHFFTAFRTVINVFRDCVAAIATSPGKSVHPVGFRSTSVCLIVQTIPRSPYSFVRLE